MRLILGVLLSCVLLAGCIDLAENVGKNKYLHGQRHSRVQAEIYTMRGGLGGVFSKGMNRLEDTLENDYGIHATSTVWFKEKSLSRRIIQHYQQDKVHPPIILVGHSLGANQQIQVAYDLYRAGIPIALLMTIDAVLPANIPPNVKHVCNIYKPSLVPLFSGLRLQAADPYRTKVDNINVDHLRGVQVNHFTIDSHPTIQKMMLHEVLDSVGVHE